MSPRTTVEPVSPGHRVPLVVLLVVVVAMLYLPGLDGPFIGDDDANIISQPMVRLDTLQPDALLAAAMSNESGPTGRVLPALSFALNYYFSGQRFDPVAFKATNLAIHVLNVLLVWLLARRVLAAGGLRNDPWLPLAALFAAAVWAVHPLQLTSVLYVVQRMNALSATGVLLGLLVWMVGRERLRLGQSGALRLMCSGLVGGFGLGLLSKENALVLPGLLLALELTVFAGATASASGRRRLLAFHAVAIGVPAIAGAWLLTVTYEGFASGFALRDFTMSERLATQTRVLWWYVGQWFAPDPAQLSLHHDDWQVSESLLRPISTLWSLVGGALALALAGAAWKHTRWPAFGIAFFLAGHALEAGPIPLELVYEHRNYLPSAGLAIAMAGMALQALASRGRSRLVATVGGVAVVGLLVLATHTRVLLWGNAPRLIAVTADLHPKSIRAQSDLAHLMDVTGMPRADVYAAFARIEALQPRTAVVRISMVELLVRLAAASHDEPVPPTGRAVIAGPASGGVTSPVLDEPRIRRETARLVTAVESHFASNRVTLADVNAARRLVQCLEHEPRQCGRLDTALEHWLNAGIGNAALDNDMRQLLLWLRARVEVSQGRIDTALQTVERAVALAPDFLVLRHQEAALLVRLGRVTEATRLVNTLAALPGNARHRLEIERLRALLDAGIAPANAQRRMASGTTDADSP